MNFGDEELEDYEEFKDGKQFLQPCYNFVKVNSSGPNYTYRVAGKKRSLLFEFLGRFLLIMRYCFLETL